MEDDDFTEGGGDGGGAGGAGGAEDAEDAGGGGKFAIFASSIFFDLAFCNQSLINEISFLLGLGFSVYSY